MRTIWISLALASMCLAAAGPARSDTVGNVSVDGGGTCHAVHGVLALKVDSLPAATPDTATFRLTLLAALPGMPAQYLTAKVTQIGKAASGAAQVFNNGFLGANGPFLNGSWSGTFPATNAVASVDVRALTITAGTGAATCTLALTDGQAIF